MTTKDLDLKQYVLGGKINPLGGQQVSSIRHVLNDKYRKILRLANFINQDLNIGMFVPAVFENDEWVVLEEPSECDCGDFTEYWFTNIKYQQAKENVLFDGRFDIHSLDNIKNEYRIFKDDICIWTTINSNDKKIEDLIKREIPLTKNAIKILTL